MKDNCILTAESVTEGHPDKLCDTIADSALDACLKGDSSAHVACEVLATAGKVLVAGEISAKVMPDIPSIVCRTIREAGYWTSTTAQRKMQSSSASGQGCFRLSTHLQPAGAVGSALTPKEKNCAISMITTRTCGNGCWSCRPYPTR